MGRKMTIEELRNSGTIVYEYRRGSHMYHLNTPMSDEDFGGVFICPPEMLFGLRDRYVEFVKDEKSDTVFFEFGRWVELLLKSNPTVLEGLFAPKDCIIGNVHPVVQEIIDHRDMFLSKECFKTFYRMAVSQIEKARGLKKKIVNPITERKDILDFCYTFKDQGSQPIKEWLAETGLDQKYCGLVNVPNMPGVYGVYYDWAAFFHFENIDWYDDFIRLEGPYVSMFNHIKVIERISKKEFFGYKGIVNPRTLTIHHPDGTATDLVLENFNEDEGPWESNDVRLSSIPKGETPICFMTYNKNGYESHCRDYKDYKEWEKERNPARYESNLNHNYDGKSIMHAMRLIRMAKELAQGKGFNVVRDDDRDFLLSIRDHAYEYEDIMAQLEKEKQEMEEAMKTCTLPDKIDADAVNELLYTIRETYYNRKNIIRKGTLILSYA